LQVVGAALFIFQFASNANSITDTVSLLLFFVCGLIFGLGVFGSIFLWKSKRLGVVISIAAQCFLIPVVNISRYFAYTLHDGFVFNFLLKNINRPYEVGVGLYFNLLVFRESNLSFELVLSSDVATLFLYPIDPLSTSIIGVNIIPIIIIWRLAKFRESA